MNPYHTITHSKQRGAYFANALYQKGTDIHVIHPLYPDWKPHITQAQMQGIKVYRGGGRLRYPTNKILRRVMLELWYSIHVFKYILKLRREKFLPDMVVPIFPPSLFFLVCLLLLPSNTFRVGIVHDLQGIYAASHGSFLGNILSKAIMKVEKKVFSNCHRLFFGHQHMEWTAGSCASGHHV